MVIRRRGQRHAATPSSRPLRRLARKDIVQRFETALEARDGVAGAHCIHELWMRKESPAKLEPQLELLRSAASEVVPEWLPTRHVEWLRLAYKVASRFEREGHGHTDLYLVLLDHGDSPRGPYGVYVGMSRYPPAIRFNQHKAGSRAAGSVSVQRRGLEVLTGPVLHLQGVKRAQAKDIEKRLAEALLAEGLLVKGGHCGSASSRRQAL